MLIYIHIANMKALIPILLITLMIGCTSNRRYAEELERARSQYSTLEQERKISEASGEIVQNERKIIYDASVTLQTEEPFQTGKQLMPLATKFGGYVMRSDNNQVVLRIESSYLNEVLDSLTNFGRIISQEISTQDVTDTYLDYEIRLGNAIQTRDRYLELIKLAESVEDIIRIEKELERLNGEIDLIKGKLNQLKHLTTYATVTIRLKEKVKPGPIGYVGLGLGKAIKWLFVRN